MTAPSYITRRTCTYGPHGHRSGYAAQECYDATERRVNAVRAVAAFLDEIGTTIAHRLDVAEEHRSLLPALVKRGWLSSSKDGRETYYSITRAGRDVIANADRLDRRHAERVAQYEALRAEEVAAKAAAGA